jgi:hypothetical protein
MKKSDLLLIILGIALVIGMLLTALLGRGSRHGYGMAPGNHIVLVNLFPVACSKNLTTSVVVVR